MASKSSGSRILLIAGRILFLLIVLIGALQSGRPTSLYDPYGFLFILIGGIALVMISFPGAEIWSAFRHASGVQVNAQISNSFISGSRRQLLDMGIAASIGDYWLYRHEI
jgi:hypothetical protein